MLNFKSVSFLPQDENEKDLKNKIKNCYSHKSVHKFEQMSVVGKYLLSNGSPNLTKDVIYVGVIEKR